MLTVQAGVPKAAEGDAETSTEAGVIDSLKVMTTGPAVAMPVEALVGAVEITVGAVVSGAATVVKDSVRGERAFPAVSEPLSVTV